jgi:hypothetical protein
MSVSPNFDNAFEQASCRLRMLMDMASAKAEETSGDERQMEVWAGIEMTLSDIRRNLSVMQDAETALSNRLYELEHPEAAKKKKGGK